MRTVCLSLGIVAFVIFSGCVHVKNACTSISPRYKREQIVTKNKYKIVKDSRTGDWNEIYRINKSLQHCQPGVFAPNGLPIQVGGRSYDPNATAFSKTAIHADGTEGVSFLLSAFTCFTFPYRKYNSDTRSYSVVVNKNKRLSSIIVKTQEERCVSIIPVTPLFSWILMSWGAPDDESEWEIDHALGISGTANVNAPLEKERALAYALAMRLKEFEDSCANAAEIFKAQSAVDETTGEFALPKYKLGEWQKVGSSYRFKLALSKRRNITATNIRALQKDFADTVLSWYLADEPLENRNELKVVYTKFDFAESAVEGEAQVLRLQIELKSSYYDSSTRRGKVAVRVAPAHYRLAREWARHNIAELARDKNVRLTLEALPPDAVFTLGHEKYENGILEMEFEVK